MIDVGYGLAQQISQATESLVLEVSLFILTGLVTFWLLVSCLVRCVTSVVTLSAVVLITWWEATAALTLSTS